MKSKILSAAAAGAACLALTVGNAGTASAQATSTQSGVLTAAPTTTALRAAPAKARCGERFTYISGNGVRIRKSPGGTVLGLANAWERVNRGHTSGSWTYVHFYQRSSGVRQGWVASAYVDEFQSTCPR